MALTFSDLQSEVKRRATRNQGGTTFDTAIKNIINLSLFRLSREAPWRSLRRKDTFETVTSYTTGSGGGTFTNGSKSCTMTGATLLTDNVKLGRRVTLQGSNLDYVLESVTSETAFTVDIAYDGTTISGTGTYSVLAQEEYNLPVQSGHRMFLWHEDFGFPYQMNYLTDQDFYGASLDNTQEDTPTHYRMWGEDMIIAQPKTAGALSISSSITGDTSISVQIFGIVSSYPDSETIITNASNGTTASVGTKSFSSVERIVKGGSSTGRITVTADSGNTTVSVLPVGDITAGIQYKKIQLWPLPSKVFPIHIQYYKDPYRLVGDNDVHELGQEFDEALIMLSTAKIKYESNQKEADKWFLLYTDEVRNLKKTNVDKIDWYPKLRSRVGTGFPAVHSQLTFAQVGSQFGPRSKF